MNSKRKVLAWLVRPHLNSVDVLWFWLSAGLSMDHYYTAALVTAFVGAILSAALEQLVTNSEKETGR